MGTSKKSKLIPLSVLHRRFAFWALTVFLVKILISINIPDAKFPINGEPFLLKGMWLGADGENYITGYQSLKNDGIYSTNSFLSYWPAGYPIFILFLSFIGESWLFFIINFVQSLFYSVAVFFFALQLSKTRLRNFSSLVLIFLLLNPTLSLSSICVGYESLASSGLILILGLLIQDLIVNSNRVFWRNLTFAALILGFISFLQPRLILSGLVGVLIWVLVRKTLKTAVIILIIATAIVATSPILLILRNQSANGFAAISTNLGITMNLGAGDDVDGSYKPREKHGVPCPKIEGNAAEQDSHLVSCVIKWNLSNPAKSAELLLNKALYFWTPWSGPEAVGSMARNPWLKVNPIIDIASNSVEGNRLVYGNTGKIISWIWMLASIALLITGFRTLWRAQGLERVVSVFAASQILLNLFISMGTLGDHRQRLPIMGMSVFLQVIGLKVITNRKKNHLVSGPSLPSRSSDLLIEIKGKQAVT